MLREDFMEAWRNDDDLAQTLTPDDCVELFLSSLMGSSDFTPELFVDLFLGYGVIDQEVRHEIAKTLMNDEPFKGYFDEDCSNEI